MNTALVCTKPLFTAEMARNRYTPATVEINLLMVTSSILFTNPEYSHRLRHVIRAKRNTIAMG